MTQYHLTGNLVTVPDKLLDLVRWRIYNKREYLADCVKAVAEGNI